MSNNLIKPIICLTFGIKLDDVMTFKSYEERKRFLNENIVLDLTKAEHKQRYIDLINTNFLVSY